MTPEDVLLRAPSEIHKARRELFDVKQRIETTRFRIKMMQADVADGVARAVDAEGKPRFKNQDQRDGAILRALEGHVEYQALQAGLREDLSIQDRIEAMLEFKENQQRNARVLELRGAPARLVFAEATP